MNNRQMSTPTNPATSLRFFSELVGIAMSHDPIIMVRVAAVYDRRRNERPQPMRAGR